MITNIPVASYTVGALNYTLYGAPTSQSYKNSQYLNFDNVDVQVVLEMTSSWFTGVTSYIFKNVPVVSVAENQNGSVYSQSAVVPKPTIHTDHMLVDGVTIKLRDITNVYLNKRGQNIEEYIDFE